ncbi:MAG: hypothetical protein R3300_18435 [Candidatus Promineifilaceae bacterium]|nr:hypothetical protein [Candidatus Promineifilaceae bacterium]
MRPFHSPLQGFASTPGPVILINSMLVGAFFGIVAVGFFSIALIPGIGIASAALILALILHSAYATRIWRRETEANAEVRFSAPRT